MAKRAPVEAAVHQASKRHQAAGRDNAARERNGIIYFIRIGDLIKIGKTLSLRQRLAGYSYPDLELLATEPGYTIREARLHSQFADSRHRGEWFHATPALMNYIAALPERGAIAQHGAGDGNLIAGQGVHALSSPELASLLGVPRGTIRRWISEDKISWQVGDGCRVYPVADVQAAYDRRHPADGHQPAA